MKTKVCNKCGEEKSINEFYKQKRNKDNLYSWCKDCQKKISKEYKQKNVEKYKIYYQKNRERHIQQGKLYRKKHPIKCWCQNTVFQHKRRGFKVLFTFKDLLPIAKQIKNCPLCDNLLDWKYGTGSNNNSPTVDRKNNENILTLNNTWIICRRCNLTKQDRTLREFMNYCKRIYKKLKEWKL